MLLLRKSDFDFLTKKMNLSSKCVKVYKYNSQNDIVSFEVENYSDFQDMMNFDIVNEGMDNQNTVNELGIRMYKIYDDILNQKKA